MWREITLKTTVTLKFAVADGYCREMYGCDLDCLTAEVVAGVDDEEAFVQAMMEGGDNWELGHISYTVGDQQTGQPEIDE